MGPRVRGEGGRRQGGDAEAAARADGGLRRRDRHARLRLRPGAGRAVPGGQGGARHAGPGRVVDEHRRQPQVRVPVVPPGPHGPDARAAVVPQHRRPLAEDRSAGDGEGLRPGDASGSRLVLLTVHMVCWAVTNSITLSKTSSKSTIRWSRELYRPSACWS